MPRIECVDAVRKAAELKPADLEGLEGRWLDVPRLQQRGADAVSNFWCGRASAAMVYNYYCKAAGKAGEYIGHDEGDPGPGQSGGKFNLRFLGGANQGKLAGVEESGAVNPLAIFSAAGWKSDSGELAHGPDAPGTGAAEVEKRFARHLEQLKRNNPVVQYTLLSKDRGHIVVIDGYKKDSERGELWLRIVDPCYPQEDLLGKGNYQIITRPETPGKEFSEYWLKARRLFEDHPDKRGKKLYQHADAENGHFFYALPDKPVKDDHELVHKLAARAGKDAGPAAACPPATGAARLPFFLNDSDLVTGEALTALYHQAERGPGGFFPLGDNGLFHCGAHLQPTPGAPILAMADGEVVAARIGSGPGEHAWGDTGFVVLRHKLKGDKAVYCLYLHLEAEPLHPDQTASRWLKRLLIDAMGEQPKKPKWRVMEAQPTWTDAEKGRFSPTNANTKDKLAPGVYDEDDELVQDAKRYVKLAGKWVRALGPDGSGPKVKELSPWAGFDLEQAAKNSPVVKDLKEGRTAILDAVKAEDGKSHKYAVDAGETVGKAGRYLGAASLHWSVFSKEAVFPTGSLPEAEFTAKDQPKLASLDLSSREHGTKDHATALIEALDPRKQVIGSKQLDWIVEPGELRHFYRTPTQCWRGRYQAVKGLADFKLDLDKLTKQDRYKSHTDTERGDFARNGKALLFWDDLAKADDFPADGKAVFVHPVTALRLMAQVKVAQDHDDPADAPGTNAGDRTHAGEDVVLVVRDAKGPLAAVDVTVKAGGATLVQAKTDAHGEIVVKLEDVAGKEIEVSVDAKVVGEKGRLVQVANETAAPGTLLPGDAPGNQKFNDDEVVPEPRLALRMKVKKGAPVKWFARWDADKLETSAPGKLLDAGTVVTAERVVYRSADGKSECVSFLQGAKEVFCWSIEEGEERLAPDLAAHEQSKDPAVRASWSARIAHLKDHPVLAGRVQNIDDGAEIQVSWQALMSLGAPDHDKELCRATCKTAAGGFALAFEPHVLTSDNNLLNTPRPVFAKLKVKDQEFSLRDQAITVYGESRFPDPGPAKDPAPLPAQQAGKELVAYLEVQRGDETDQPTTWAKAPFPSRKLTDLSGAAAHRLSGDGADGIWVAACAPSQHLAVAGENSMGVAEALAHHAAALRAAYPDAPEWLVARDGAGAVRAGNGLQIGICAVDCKSGVAAAGKKTGCTEAVRQKNLGSCHNGTETRCQSAIQLGTFKTVKKDGCPAVIASCGAAEHDKSHCFVAGGLHGDRAAERERWHVRLPMRTTGAGYPYLRENGKNVRVLLVNPLTGAAVVCAQEARGPQEGARVAASYETFWKLGLSRAGAEEPEVLLAFVDAATPLGPLEDDVPLKVKKTASYDTLMGDAPPVTPGAPGDKVKSSNISVGGMHFVDWYNTVLRKQLYPGVNSDFLYLGQKQPNFPGPLNKAAFATVFDNLSHLWAKEVTLQEFLALLLIFANETGGMLKPIAERGGRKYWFEAGKKASYNTGKGTILAGVKLRQLGVPLDDAQFAAWNGTGPYPDDAGIQDKVDECDFVKFRGHGLIQLTFRYNYLAHCEPALKEHYGKGLDGFTTAQLEQIILEDPKVYLRMVKSFFTAGKAKFAKVNDDDFYPNGTVVAGSGTGGQAYAKLYNWRCTTALEEMRKAGYQFR